MNTSLLAQELEPLNEKIEQARKKQEALAAELRCVEAELETFAAERQRFDALRDVCSALDKLEELNAAELFWEGMPEAGGAAGHLERIRDRIVRFEEEIKGVLQKQTSLKEQIDRRQDELDFLYEEVRDAYDREERRKEEFVIEREISPVPSRTVIMPWTKEAESEKRFRRAVLLALLLCFLFGSLIPLINVPIPDRSLEPVVIPERLAMLVKKEPPPPPKPKPVPKLPKEEPKKSEKESKPEEVKKPPKETKPRSEEPKQAKPPKEKAPKPEQPKMTAGGGEEIKARKKAESVGVLAFKKTFADLMKETTVAKLGTQGRLIKKSPLVAGAAVARRSLVAMQAQGGSSGGISNVGISRNIGNGNADRLGGSGLGSGGNGNGEGFGRVESSIANLEESSRPLSDGPGPGRTDEEIQIVFDRYKATLYRIYNRELRKDPTLRGKILLRIAIEGSGAVSMCEVESSDLDSPELVAKIVARIKRFNFGPKEGVPKMVILYPIDFLPAA